MADSPTAEVAVIPIHAHARRKVGELCTTTPHPASFTDSGASTFSALPVQGKFIAGERSGLSVPK
ncbi:MAG: hypothetical protein Fur0034_02200 [Desulfuromonadia bacterium]